MQNTQYSFLDLTVMPFLRRKVITNEAALVFDTELSSILWANAAGTKLFGGNNVGELLDIDLNNASDLMNQVKNALTQIQNDEPIVRGYRVSKGITSQLVKGELSFKTLPNGSKVVLLVFAETKGTKRRQEHELASMAVDSLEGFADAAAIVDEFGLTIASSSKFDDMNVYPTVLQDLVKLTASENDRMVKRPIEQFANKTIAAGIGRIRDLPGRYLIVLADIGEDIPQTPETSQVTSQVTASKQHKPTDLSQENPKPVEKEISTSEPDILYEIKVDKNEPSLIDRLQLDTSSLNAPASFDVKDTSLDAITDETDAAFTLTGDEQEKPEASPLRFSFTIDSDKTFREITPQLAKAVGPDSANVVGLNWEQISTAYGFDQTGAIGNLLKKADTWAGKSILWPVQGTDMLIPLDLAALPTFTKERRFDGFRGFGIIRSEDAVIDPAGRGLRIDELHKSANLPTTAFNDQDSADISSVITPGILSDKGNNTNDSVVDDTGDTWTDNWAGSSSDRGTHEDENTTTKDNSTANLQFGSNVTPLNVVPIRSHVEIAKSETSLSDEDKHDRLFEEHDLATSDHKLNQKERTAFEQIKRRLEKDNKSKSAQDVFENAPQLEDVPINLIALDESSNDDDETSVVDFSSAVLVYRADETLFANDQLLEIAGYTSLDELTKAGGLEALLSTDQFDDEDEIKVLKLQRKDGSLIKAQPILKRVDWDGAKALSLTFTKVDEPLTSARDVPTISEQNAIDMVKVSDLESILDTATDGIIVVDENGKIEKLNASGEALFGTSFDDVEGKNFTSLFAKESQKILDEYFTNLNNPGVSGILNDGREVIGVEANGGMIPLFISMGSIGSSNRYCAVLRDLTEWKKSEENLVTAKRKAEHASDQKTEFLSRISHEIREPLNAIIGFSDVIIEERFGELDNARYREYLRDINKSGVHMLDLVNDLLDISKIESGKLDLSYESVDLNLIARETVALLQPQANSQRIIIRTSLSRAVPNVVADVRSIRQIIMNLVSNAIKFSPQNSQVIVSTTYEANGEVGLRIRDTGHGMNATELKLALEPYTQIPNESVGTKSGTGLGLPLTKALVEANRAYFDLESAPGEGTIAHVQFPSPRVLAD